MHTVYIRQKRSKGIFTHDFYCLQTPYLIFKKITKYEQKSTGHRSKRIQATLGQPQGNLKEI